MNNDKEHTITVPAGYKAILVPDEVDMPPHPDYEECARQANLATGLDEANSMWLSIFKREINRWCWQAYGQFLGADSIPAEELPTNELYETWADKQDCNVTIRQAFEAACALRLITPKTIEQQFFGLLGFMFYTQIVERAPDEGSTKPFFKGTLELVGEAEDKKAFINEKLTEFAMMIRNRYESEANDKG